MKNRISVMLYTAYIRYMTNFCVIMAQTCFARRVCVFLCQIYSTFNDIIEREKLALDRLLTQL